VLSAGARFDPAAEVRAFTLLGAGLRLDADDARLSETVAALAPGISLHLSTSARGDVDRLLIDDKIDMAVGTAARASGVDLRAGRCSDRLRDHRRQGKSRSRRCRLKEGDAIPIDLFCAVPHALRSIDGSVTGSVADALAAMGRRRQVVLTLPQFYGVALAGVARPAAGRGSGAVRPGRRRGIAARPLRVADPDPGARNQPVLASPPTTTSRHTAGCATRSPQAAQVFVEGNRP
jgi:hypothetical protein